MNPLKVSIGMGIVVSMGQILAIPIREIGAGPEHLLGDGQIISPSLYKRNWGRTQTLL